MTTTTLPDVVASARDALREARALVALLEGLASGHVRVHERVNNDRAIGLLYWDVAIELRDLLETIDALITRDAADEEA